MMTIDAHDQELSMPMRTVASRAAVRGTPRIIDAPHRGQAHCATDVSLASSVRVGAGCASSVRARTRRAVRQAVFYSNAPHILTAPAQRLSSMTRNLDWFKFWLLNEEDDSLTKRDQYERWHRLRTTHQQRLNGYRPKTQYCQQ
jgi:hypothetical protein